MRASPTPPEPRAVEFHVTDQYRRPGRFCLSMWIKATVVALQIKVRHASTERFLDAVRKRVLSSIVLWGCLVSTGDSEATDAYRGPRSALSSLENTIANSDLALAA